MIANYKKFKLIFYLIPILLGITVLIFTYLKYKSTLPQPLEKAKITEKFKNITIRGCVFNETQTVINNKIIVGLYTDQDLIKKKKPIISSTLEKINDCFSLDVNYKFAGSQLYLAAYTTDKNNKTIWNDWYLNLITVENMYKNLFLVEPLKLNTIENKKPFLYTQTKKTLNVYQENITDKQVKELSKQDKIKEAYNKLMAEYYTEAYLANNVSPPSFDEFLAIKKDKLISEGKYTQEEAEKEKDINEYINKNQTLKSSFLEINKYTFVGKLQANTKNLCKIIEPAIPEFKINLYLNGLLNHFPIHSNGYNLHPLQALTNTVADCSNGSFILNFSLPNLSSQESSSVYISTYVYDINSPYYLIPRFIGTAYDINGVPASYLSKRTDQKELVIKLEEYNNEDSKLNLKFTDLRTQKPVKGLLVFANSLDSIGTVIKNFNLFKSKISTPDGIARLNTLPMGSNIVFDIIDTEKRYPRHNFVFTTQTPSADISIPISHNVLTKKESAGLYIIIPKEISHGEIVLSSSAKQNRLSKEFFVLNNTPFILSDLAPEFTILELRVKGKSLGIMPLNLKKETVTIVEPYSKNINEAVFNLNVLNTIKTATPCQHCKINIKYTDKKAAFNKGVAVIKDVSIIDDNLELSINNNNINYYATLPLHQSMNKIVFNAQLPSKSLLDAWNMVEPTTANNGSLYGEFVTGASYKAVLASLDTAYIKELMYFDDLTGLPVKNEVSSATSFNPLNVGFSKFYLPNIPKGDYVLYIFNKNKIIHSRQVKIFEKTVSLVL